MFRILRFPFTWFSIGLVVIVAAVQIVTVLFGETGVSGTVVAPLIGAGAVITLYWLVMRWVAARAVPELAVRRVVSDALLGIAIGAAFVLISVGILAVTGTYTFAWIGGDLAGILAPLLAVNIGVAVFEEFLFRGLLFQAVQQLGGRWIALAATSVLFGIAHLLSPGATIWTAIAIVLEAGILLGAAFLWRGTLWFVSGLHFALNAAQGILGLPGSDTVGLLQVTVHGSGIVSGGAGGFGASIVTLAVGVAMTAAMLMLVQSRFRGVNRTKSHPI